MPRPLRFFRQKEQDNTIPMVEIFGSTFALLLIIFLILNVLTESKLLTILNEQPSEGEYKIDWESSGEGYIVMVFPDRIKILETGTTISKKNICQQNSDFIGYAKKIYSNKKKQIIFSILEGSVHTTAVARNCLYRLFQKKPISIGWIIANNELLKAVSINEIPYYIENAIKK